MRWDGDMRGRGVGNGSWMAAEVQDLLDALALPDWVSEDPESHLLEHVTSACAASGFPWTLDHANPTDDAYLIQVTWERPAGRLRDLRADAFALVGAVAESVTFVHQVVGQRHIDYRMTTGMLHEDTHFAPHGHLVVLRVGGPTVERILTAAAPS
jgi:hypothetical protein